MTIVGPGLQKKRVARGAVSEAVSAAPARVLLVDPDHNRRCALAIGLRVLGHEALEADSGASCIERVLHREVDLAVVALLLPDMNGFDLARVLAELCPQLRIALVARDDEAPIPLGATFDLPLAAFFTNPLRLEELVALIAPAR